jgi:ribonuclease HI
VHFSIHPLLAGIDDIYIKREIAIKNINEKWWSSLHIYTDGSLDDGRGKVGCGVFIPQFKYSKGYKLPENVSIFTAELAAIYFALIWVSQVEPAESCILSDSLSSLQAIARFNPSNKIICDIRHILNSIHGQGLVVHFDWVPAHCGVYGNEMVDSIAKSAANHGKVDASLKINKNEMKHVAKKKITIDWQRMWKDVYDTNFLKQIQPNVKTNMARWGGTRGDEVIFHRLRMGMGKGLKSYLCAIGKYPNDLCEMCHVKDTVDHMLLHCRKYSTQRVELKRKIIQANIKFDVVGLLGGNKAPFGEVIHFIKQCKVDI